MNGAALALDIFKISRAYFFILAAVNVSAFSWVLIDIFGFAFFNYKLLVKLTKRINYVN